MFNDCKGVIFDFNGTLFIDHDKHTLAWGKISQVIRGKEATLEELHNHINGVPNHRVIPYMMGRDCSAEELSYYSLLKEEYYREFCRADKPGLHLLDGATELFELLKSQGIPFTIASASIKPNIDFFVESFDLARWFEPDKIIYDDGTYANKIKMFQHAADVIGVPIQDCLIFEDSTSGIRNAYEAGCHHIMVVDSTDLRQDFAEFPGVVQVIRTFAEWFCSERNAHD